MQNRHLYYIVCETRLYFDGEKTENPMQTHADSILNNILS